MKKQLFSAQRAIALNFLKRTNPIFWIGHLAMAGYWYGLMRAEGLKNPLKIWAIPACYILFMLTLPFIIVWFGECMKKEVASKATRFRIRLAGLILITLPIWGFWKGITAPDFDPSRYSFREASGNSVSKLDVSDLSLIQSYFTHQKIEGRKWFGDAQINEYNSETDLGPNQFSWIFMTSNGMEIETSWESTGITPMQDHSLKTAQGTFWGAMVIFLFVGLIVYLGFCLLIRPEKYIISKWHEIGSVEIKIPIPNFMKNLKLS